MHGSSNLFFFKHVFWWQDIFSMANEFVIYAVHGSIWSYISSNAEWHHQLAPAEADRWKSDFQSDCYGKMGKQHI